MLDARHERFPGGAVVVNNDPFVVYDERMKIFAGNKFEEAARIGYTSKEDKARYLSGRLYESLRFCTQKGAMDKKAIDVFDDMLSSDEKRKCVACPQRATLQRALLESQGIKTRFVTFGFIPRTYPLKPMENEAVAKENDRLRALIRPLAGAGLLKPFHLTVEGWFCDDDARQDRCSWKLVDSTFDDTTRLLKTRPVVDPDGTIGGQEYPQTFLEWKTRYHDANLPVKILNDVIENVPIIGEAIQSVFENGTKLWDDANPHVPTVPRA